jgi:CRP/FNR family cyclic AMP-dependent transcriptional regulator
VASKPKRGLTPTAFFQQTGPGISIRTYQDKEVIYSQESPADAVFYLQSGMVKLTMTSKRRRKKAVIAILQKGELFGEGCLESQTRRVSAAMSVGPSTITRLEKAIFRRKIDRDLAFAGMFIEFLLRQSARFKADLGDHCLNFSERRLARILLMHGSFVQKSKSGPTTLRFSQTMLAEMVGTTRSRVSHFMTEFRKQGYIRYNGGIEIDANQLTTFLQG